MRQYQELSTFYSQYELQNGFGRRSSAEAQWQQSFVKQISDRNFKALQIMITNKRSVKYEPSKLQKIDLDDGIYCNITDNQIKSEQAIITIHGAPGNHTEWAGLETQMKGRYRWINIMTPGFDGEDERRGAYDGTLDGFADLFLRLVNKLKLKRIIVCAHSFGSAVGFYLVQSFPHLIEGFVNLTGLSNIWSIGISYLYKSCIVDSRFFEEEWKSKKLFDSDEHREKIYEEYVANYISRNYEKVKIPLLSKTEYFGFLKLTFQHPQHFGRHFSRFRDCQMFRVLAYANNDHLVTQQQFQITIHTLINDPSSYLHKPKWQKLFKTIKPFLEKRLKQQLGIDIEGEKIQEYLCVAFDETGHNIHRRRPQELSRIIEVYLISLQVIQENKILLESSL